MNRILPLVIVLLFPFVVAAEMIVDELRFNNQSIPVKLLVYTQKEPAPTIIISHGSSCIPPRKIQWADRIEEWGYNAVVIDHCVKRGVKAHPAQQLPKNLQVVDRIRDYVAVADWVKQQPFNKGKVGLIGFSRGGEAVLGLLNESHYASQMGMMEGYSRAIDAAVAYYPSCLLGDRELREPPVPLLVNVGERDSLTPITNCLFYKDSAAGKTPNLTVEVYPGAHHGFEINLPDQWAPTPRGNVLVLSYNAKQAERSFENTKAFFDKNLK
jgi:dienelactone hydrolase